VPWGVAFGVSCVFGSWAKQPQSVFCSPALRQCDPNAQVRSEDVPTDAWTTEAAEEAMALFGEPMISAGAGVWVGLGFGVSCLEGTGIAQHKLPQFDS